MLQRQGCFDDPCEAGITFGVANDRLDAAHPKYRQTAIIAGTSAHALLRRREEGSVDRLGLNYIPCLSPGAVSLKVLWPV